jgi:hypothetical protein
MFIALFYPNDSREVLLNTDHISTIEVVMGTTGPQYGNESSRIFRTTVDGKHSTSKERRHLYELTVANQKYIVDSHDNNAVTKALDKIYEEAIRG